MKTVENVVYDLIDSYTGEYATYKKIAVDPIGNPIDDAWLDNGMVRKVNGEYFINTIKEIDVTRFGAVSDAVNYYTASGSNIGKVLKADNVTNATAITNNIAFKRAIKFIHNYALPVLNHSAIGLVGYRQTKLVLKVPAGSYLLTEPEIFSKIGAFIQGFVEAGLVIEGDGYDNSTIVFRNDGDISKYLINNDNYWKGLVIKNIGFKCVTGNELIYNESSAGAAGATEFDHVSFEGYKKAINISGTANADRMLFNRVFATSNIPGNVFFEQNNNSQAVKHSFTYCNLSATDGTVFRNNASGCHVMVGCAIDAFGASTIFDINPPSGDLGEQVNISFSNYSNKIELHGTSRLADITGAAININGEVICTNYSTNAFSVVLRNNLSAILFDQCHIKNLPIAFINNVNPDIPTKPRLVMRDCKLLGPMTIDTSLSVSVEEWITNNLFFKESDLTTNASSSIANYVFEGCYDNNTVTPSNARKIITNQVLELDGSSIKMKHLAGATNGRIVLVDADGNIIASTQPGLTGALPTAGFIPVVTANNALGQSEIYQNEIGDIGINTPSPAVKVQIHAGTDTNLGFIKTGSVLVLNAFTDDAGANVPVQFRASSFDFAVSPISVLNGTDPVHAVNKSQLDAKTATAQADSTATTIAGLKDDFNALLAKMRNAGLLAT